MKVYIILEDCEVPYEGWNDRLCDKSEIYADSLSGWAIYSNKESAEHDLRLFLSNEYMKYRIEEVDLA